MLGVAPAISANRNSVQTGALNRVAEQQPGHRRHRDQHRGNKDAGLTLAIDQTRDLRRHQGIRHCEDGGDGTSQ